jgi:toxin YoeB
VSQAPELVFDPDFLEDLAYWISTDSRVAVRILQLVQAVRRDPQKGIGKPEPLRHLGSGYWSRRITQEHRLVYRLQPARVYFLQCHYHY